MAVTLISPFNERIRFKSNKEAARKIGMCVKNVSALKTGRLACYKSWRSTHPSRKKEHKLFKSRNAFVNLDTKELWIACNRVSLQEMSRLSGLHIDSIRLINRGAVIGIRGWVLRTTYDFLYGPGHYSSVKYFIKEKQPHPNKTKTYTIE